MSTSECAILLIEDDESVLQLLTAILQDEGFFVYSVSNPTEARLLLSTLTFDVILTDLFGNVVNPTSDAISVFIAEAAPTPVGIMTARTLPASFAVPSAAFILQKPFDVESCISALMAAVHQALDPATDAEAALIMRFFAAIASADEAATLALCTEDVLYVPSPVFRQHAPLQGKAACRAYLAQLADERTEVTMSDIHIYPLPHGRVARYTHHSRRREGNVRVLTAAATFHFEGNLIRAIGIRETSEGSWVGIPSET